MKNSLICLYGPSGAGKTRLLMALEEALNSEGALRTGAEVMAGDVAASVRDPGMEDFRRKYLLVENLLIDNLWVLQNKPVPAREISRLVGDRQKAGKLTVLASDLSEQEWAERSSDIARLLADCKSAHFG